MDFPEFTRNLSVADCIKEVTEDLVRVRVHVGALAVPLQRLKFPNRFLLNRGVFDLRFGWN